ncbi:MAG: PilZ domain-containing protein [Chloroflexi bacterium]|nr:PilZ domain-containing protein [Chloroflexota bacterium]
MRLCSVQAPGDPRPVLSEPKLRVFDPVQELIIERNPPEARRSEMDERRILKRQHIMFYSRVFDRQTGAFIGYLGNLTESGAMIISEEALETEKTINLRIDLPEDIYGRPVLNLTARSVWCQPDIDPNFYNIGFALEVIPDEDLELIMQIIEDYGLPGYEGGG